MIGTGEEINIWDDPWLSHSEQIRPIGPSPENYTTLKVSDFLLPDTAEWSVEKIEQILPFHKEQMLKL